MSNLDLKRFAKETNERIVKIATASPATLARVDAVLNGTAKGDRADEDCRLCTYTEAARRLNLSRPTVYRLVRAGRLEVVPLNGVNRIRIRSIMNLVGGAR